MFGLFKVIFRTIQVILDAKDINLPVILIPELKTQKPTFAVGNKTLRAHVDVRKFLTTTQKKFLPRTLLQ